MLDPIRQTVVQHRRSTKIKMEVSDLNTDPENFMKFFMKALEQLALSRDLTGTDMRVFFALVYFSKDNEICISQKELGEYLGISRPDVTKSTMKLGTLDYLTVVDHIGNQNVYMLNPDIVFSGDGKQRQIAREKYRNPINQVKTIGKKIGKAILPQTLHKPSDADIVY